MRMRVFSLVACLSLAAVVACAAPSDNEETSEEAFTQVREGTPEAQGVIAVANTLGSNDLANKAMVPLFTARNIERWRWGVDGVLGGADDRSFATLAQLRTVRGVGDPTIEKLLQYAKANGLAPADPVWIPFWQRYTPAEAAMMLEVLNRATPTVMDPGLGLPDSLSFDRLWLHQLAGGLAGPYTTPPGGRVQSLQQIDNHAQGSYAYLLEWAKTRGVGNSLPGDPNDPYDAASCTGPAMTGPELIARFAPAATTAPLGRYQLLVRSRACNNATGCGPWVEENGETAQGNASLGIQNDRPVLVLEDDRRCATGPTVPASWRNFGFADNGLAAVPYAFHDLGAQGCERKRVLPELGDPLYSGKISHGCFRLRSNKLQTRATSNRPARDYEVVIIGLY